MIEDNDQGKELLAIGEELLGLIDEFLIGVVNKSIVEASVMQDFLLDLRNIIGAGTQEDGDYSESE